MFCLSPRHAFEYEDPELDCYSSNGISGSKVRRAPPPPPKSHRNQGDGSPFYDTNSHSEYENLEELLPRSKTQGNNEYGKDFENFRVTIKNANSKRRSNTTKLERKGRGRSMDGTPSLSGVDDEEIDEYDDESCYENTADEESEDEESKQRRHRHRRGGGGEEAFSDETRSPSLPKVEPKKKGSIKDRLGSRVPVRPPSPPDSPPERQRRAPPLTPPYDLHDNQSESHIRRKRPPSPITSPPYTKKERIGKSDNQFERRERIHSDKKSSSKQARGGDRGLSTSNPRKRKVSDPTRRPRSPRNKVNKRNGRSWSAGKDNLGSRYGNRSPTPLPGTPRRVREARAREAAAKEGKHIDKEKRKSNPIYGKSKMRMDNEHQSRNSSRERSCDAVRNKESKHSRHDSSRSRKPRKSGGNKDQHNRSPSRRRKTQDSARSRTNSGGFGKGVIGKNRDRNTSGGNRPPTPVPIGSKSQSKRNRKNNEKLRARSRDYENATKTKKRRKEETSKENEIMLRKLARKRKGLPQSSQTDKNHSLAKIAGIEIPVGTAGLNSSKNIIDKRENSVTCSEKSEISSKDSDDESGNRSASRSPSSKGRKRDWKSGKCDSKSNRGKKSPRNNKSKNDRHDSLSDRDDCSRSRSRSKGVS